MKAQSRRLASSHLVEGEREMFVGVSFFYLTDESRDHVDVRHSVHEQPIRASIRER